MAALQTSATSILLESLSGPGAPASGASVGGAIGGGGAPQPMLLDTGVRIETLDLAKGCLLVGDGARAALFRVSDDLVAIPAGGFDAGAYTALALHSEWAFGASGTCVDVLLHSGQVRRYRHYDFCFVIHRICY